MKLARCPRTRRPGRRGASKVSSKCRTSSVRSPRSVTEIGRRSRSHSETPRSHCLLQFGHKLRTCTCRHRRTRRCWFVTAGTTTLSWCAVGGEEGPVRGVRRRRGRTPAVLGARAQNVTLILLVEPVRPTTPLTLTATLSPLATVSVVDPLSRPRRMSRNWSKQR